MITTAAVYDGAAAAHGRESKCEPRKTLRKRIGSTDYIVTVHFSNASETTEQKLLRLMKKDVRYDKE